MKRKGSSRRRRTGGDGRSSAPMFPRRRMAKKGTPKSSGRVVVNEGMCEYIGREPFGLSWGTLGLLGRMMGLGRRLNENGSIE